MVDAEDYFPRGGKKPTTKFFKQSANFLGAPEKAEKKKKKKIKKKADDDDGYLSDEVTRRVDQSYKNCGLWLKYSVVKEGLLLLGRVRQVHDTRVYVSLPCRLNGLVMACHISEAYNKLLEAYVNDESDKVQDLQHMFRPGQYVVLKVLEGAADHLMLTMMPQHINSGKMPSDLHKGALLQVAVSSIEDHGYVMDIGIPSIRAFLPKNAANPEINLHTGMVTWCIIKSITSSADSSVVTLASDLSALQKAFQKKPSTVLLPGNAVDFTVDKALDNGIEGRIFDDKVAYIQRQHVLLVNGKKPALGQKIRARILYVLPTTNTPFLTMKNIFETTYPDLEAEQKFQEGDIIEQAQVIKIVGKTVHLRLGQDSVGLLSLRRVLVNEDLSDEEMVAKSYPLGSKHKVRVLRYNMCDFSYAVTDERDVVEERYFALSDLAVGQRVDGTVASVADSHVVLQVGRVTGYVPQSHLTDSGVYVDPKKASNSKLSKAKYKVGQRVSARVLSVEPARRTLYLTLKPTLLTPELRTLYSYEDAVVGQAYTAVVAHIKDYLVVSFFGNVHAYVPRHLATGDPHASLAGLFHLGQIVTCTILRVDVNKKKLSGSLTTAPFTPSENLSKKRKKNKDIAESPIKKHKVDNENDKENELKKIKSDEENVKIKDGQTKKKKRKHNDLNQDEFEVTVVESKKKSKLMNEAKEDNEDIADGNEAMDSGESKNKGKKKKIVQTMVLEVRYTDDEDIEESKENKKKKKKNKQIENNASTTEQLVTEESDAIETDFYEDSDHVLTPQDLQLIDMSECKTSKQYKKRVVSLFKAIKARSRRIDTIQAKIVALEDKGLNAKNKKFHTAMHMEKLVIEERIKKLLLAMDKAQEKLVALGLVQNKDYKKKAKKNKASTDEKENDKLNSSKEKDDATKKPVNNDKLLKTKLKDIKVVEDQKPALEVPSAKDFWKTDMKSSTKTVQEETSSSDEEQEEKPKKKRKKLTAAEKVAKAREEEERIRELERRAVDSETQPRSSEQFERALLANPNCSQLWIAYMAFHLQATEIEKARGVARKALATISFREEDERLNVWLALLNLENRFGTKESLQQAVEEAVQVNDAFSVHCALLDMYAETGKTQELEALSELVARRHRARADAYVRAAAALYRAARPDRARRLMQRALTALPKKEHVGVLVQFAQLERRAGASERAEALLEQVLAVYPQRVDVCAVYADALVKSRDIERVRQLMERMTSHKLPARKMKVLFKKWIEVEEKIGDKEHADGVRQRAADFLEKAKF